MVSVLMTTHRTHTMNIVYDNLSNMWMQRTRIVWVQASITHREFYFIVHSRRTRSAHQHKLIRHDLQNENIILHQSILVVVKIIR